MEIVDPVHRVFVLEHFLSDAEADEFIRLAERELEEQYTSKWRRKARATMYYSDEHNLKSHPLVRALEERVGKWTLIPPHADESDIMFTFTKKYDDGQSNELHNVHHDCNGSENRVLTVLIYLTDVTAGGYTVFPCLGDKDHQKDLAQTFSKAFYEERRRVLYPPPHWNATAFDVVNRMCRGDLESVRFQPRKGTAVLFASRFVDGFSDPLMWHGACRVLDDSYKMTLQIFKELPRVHGEWQVPGWTMDGGSPSHRPVWDDFADTPYRSENFLFPTAPSRSS